MTVLTDIAPETVGLKTFLGTEFTLRLTYDIVKNEGGIVDYRLGAFVNGKPCGDGAYLVKCAEVETLRSAMFIYAGNKGSIIINSEKSAVDFSIFGFDKSTWKQALNIS